MVNRMFKAINSFKTNGFINTVAKIIDRILKKLGLRVSETYFFQIDLNDVELRNSRMKPYKMEYLDHDRKTQFENMKYFDFLDVNSFLVSDKADILIALDESEIIGYICVHQGVDHLIYNLGYWSLNDNEAWIGPTYVVNDYRNKGIHGKLINEFVKQGYSNGISKIYTAINSENIPSIRSFSKVGFKLIGRVKIRKTANRKISVELLDINNKNVLKEKLTVSE